MLFGDPFKPEKRKRTLNAADKKRIAANQSWKCKKCRKTLPARFHIDHIKEFSNGGSDKESNLQALCPNCHAEKTENDRHRQKQLKIEDKETPESSDLYGNFMFGEPPKKGRKKKSENPFDLGSNNLWGGGNVLGGSPKKGRKKKTKNPFDLGSNNEWL